MFRALRQAYTIKDNFKSIFRRPNDNLAVLDGLRGFSILWVLIFHVYILTVLTFSPATAQQLLRDTPWGFNWIWNGDKGVDIFFVISGFLISGLLFRELQQTNGVDLKSFYLRRFLRLTPVYWFTLGLYVLFGAPHAENIWTNMLYINNFVPATEMAMTWTWSLAVEEQFYLIFPLFLIFIFWKSTHKLYWLIALLGLSLLVRWGLYVSEPTLANADLRTVFNLERSELFNRYFDVLYANLYSRFGPFVIGIMASYLYFNHRQRLSAFFQSTQSGWVVMAGFALTVSVALAPSYHQHIEYTRLYQVFYVVGNRTLFAIGISVLMLAALFPFGLIGKCFNKLFSFGFWVPIAHLSYSIYIFHVFVVGWVLLNFKYNLKAKGLPIDNVDFYWLLLAIPIALILSCFIAVLLYVFIEKPFMNLRKGFRPRLVTEINASPNLQQTR